MFVLREYVYVIVYIFTFLRCGNYLFVKLGIVYYF